MVLLLVGMAFFFFIIAIACFAYSHKLGRDEQRAKDEYYRALSDYLEAEYLDDNDSYKDARFYK